MKKIEYNNILYVIGENAQDYWNILDLYKDSPEINIILGFTNPKAFKKDKVTPILFVVHIIIFSLFSCL